MKTHAKSHSRKRGMNQIDRDVLKLVHISSSSDPSPWIQQLPALSEILWLGRVEGGRHCRFVGTYALCCL